MIELGVNAIEFDLQRTVDDNLVISHDDNLKRVFGQDFPMYSSSLRDLRSLTGDKIPTLQEALEFIDIRVDKIIVELKNPGYKKEVIRQIQKVRLRDHVIGVSFHESCLSECREGVYYLTVQLNGRCLC